jgi:hypothetical protein
LKRAVHITIFFLIFSSGFSSCAIEAVEARGDIVDTDTEGADMADVEVDMADVKGIFSS